MLALLLDRKNGGDGTGYLEILREDLNMLEAEGSLFYRYGMEKGIEKGIEQERQRVRDVALQICRQRFNPDEPSLISLAERLHAIPDSEALSKFLLHLSTAATLDEALSPPPPSANGHRNGKKPRR
jgi:hypothetical protein